MSVMVVGADGSDASLEAARVAARLAKATGARLVAVHAHTVPALLSPEMAADHLFDDYVADVERITRQRTQEALEGTAFEFRVMAGDPADCLAEAADDLEADLVAVGSRGHGVMKRV